MLILSFSLCMMIACSQNTADEAASVSDLVNQGKRNSVILQVRSVIRARLCVHDLKTGCRDISHAKRHRVATVGRSYDYNHRRSRKGLDEGYGCPGRSDESVLNSHRRHFYVTGLCCQIQKQAAGRRRNAETLTVSVECILAVARHTCVHSQWLIEQVSG